MTDYQKANLRLECLRLAKETMAGIIKYDFALKPKHMPMGDILAFFKEEKILIFDSRNGEESEIKFTTEYNIADEIYAYCIGEQQPKEMD